MSVVLYRGEAPEPVANARVSRALLNETVQLSALRYNTTYRVVLRAWADDAETKPIDAYDVDSASCTTSFTTGADPAVELGPIKLTLRNRTYSGTASGATITVVEGKVIPSAFTGAVTTLAGGAEPSYQDADVGADARFANPFGMAVDAAGNVYVADVDNHRIRKVAPDGKVTTFAGFDYDQFMNPGAGLLGPQGVAVGADGTVYVGDTINNLIRKVTPTGEMTTLAGQLEPGHADGSGTSAQFAAPSGLAVDAAGNVYVADSFNNCIRKITPAGVVSTLAGNQVPGFNDGDAAGAQFDNPIDVAVDGNGHVYVADLGNHRIRKIVGTTVSTLAGDGTPAYLDSPSGASARFSAPMGVTVDASGNVYVADNQNHCIRKIAADGAVTTVAGNGAEGYVDATGTAARFFVPQGVAVDAAGKLYVADFGNHRIRKIQ